MRIGDEVHVHGYVDEIRKDCVIIRNKGGYFGTIPEEVLLTDIKAVSGWIPCEEMLPREYSNDERVLATTDVDGLGVILMPIYDVVSWYRKGYISAWMPLPKPYGEREGE